MLSSDFAGDNSYNNLVSNSNQVIESVILIFGILIALAAVISVVIVIILSIKSKHKFEKNVEKMVENIKKEEGKENPKHECNYCGQMMGDEDYCPSCGAKQNKE